MILGTLLTSTNGIIAQESNSPISRGNPGIPRSRMQIKDEFVKIIKKFSKIYFTEVLGYCITGNHFNLLVQMMPDRHFTDADIKKRVEKVYGKELFFNEKDIPAFRAKWFSLSKYIQEIKQGFSRYFNRKYDRGGTQGFVNAQYEKFKDYFQSKKKKIPHAVSGIEGMLSLYKPNQLRGI